MKKTITATLLSILISPSIIFGSHHGKEDFTSEPVKRSLQEQLANLNPNVEIACTKSKQKDVVVDDTVVNYPEDGVLDESLSLEENFIKAVLTDNHPLLKSCLAKEKFLCNFHNQRHSDEKISPRLMNIKITNTESYMNHRYMKNWNLNKQSQKFVESIPILLLAIRINNKFAIETLIKHGANINEIVAPNGNSYLHFMAIFNETETIKLLINAKVDLNQQNNNGQTPLLSIARHFATLKKNVFTMSENDIVNYRIFKRKAFELLLSAGANPYIKNNHNNSPLDYLNGYDKFYYQLIFQNFQLPKKNQKSLKDLHKLSFAILVKYDEALKELQNKTELTDISAELLIIQQEKEAHQSLWHAENLVLMERQSELEKDFNTNNQDQEK